MPVLHEDSRLSGPKRQLHEVATREVDSFVAAKISKCYETAKYSFVFCQVMQNFLSAPSPAAPVVGGKVSSSRRTSALVMRVTSFI